MSEECLFCKIIAGEVPSTTVYEDDAVYAFRDINPMAPTHVLVVPRSHIAGLDEVQTEHVDLLGRMLLAANVIAQQEGLSQGHRVFINTGPHAGQVVFHLHLHLIGGERLGSGH